MRTRTGGSSPRGKPYSDAMTRSLHQWRQQIGSVTAAAIRGTALERALGASPEQRMAFATAFTDDAGHRRPIDFPLLAWVLGLENAPAPPPQMAADRPDLRLWCALQTRSVDPHTLIATATGAIAPECQNEGIEVWTEVELACLHALWWHARLHGSDTLRHRALDHANWLMAEIQPDNGTNHAWAVAAFVELAAAGDADAALYAETLLHNCQVTLGRADRFSAVLLVDATRYLDERISDGEL